ncbi:MAG: MFS transporter [Streptosporangiaceae bacterium]
MVAGCLIGLPVPFMLAYGPSWAWVIAANVLLGVNQGLTWSMTVSMKIDLIGPGRRGVALGINETAGYLGVAVTALATGYLATWFGLRPAPELLGAGYAIAGLALSALADRDTAAWARRGPPAPRQAAPHPPFREIALRVSWTDRTLAAVSQAGLVTNLNDGLVWVVLPVLLVDHGVSVTGVGYIKALYPFMWAAGMIAAGHLAGRIGRKPRSWPGCSSRPPAWPSSPPASPTPWRPGWPAPSSSASAPPRSARRCSPRSATPPTPAGGIRPGRLPVLARRRLRQRRPDRRHNRRPGQPRRSRLGGGRPHRRLRPPRLDIQAGNPSPAGASPVTAGKSRSRTVHPLVRA